jgi:hypothetical protein
LGGWRIELEDKRKERNMRKGNKKESERKRGMEREKEV